MSNKGNKDTGIWDLIQAAKSIRSSGCWFGTELHATKNNKRLPHRKMPKKKR